MSNDIVTALRFTTAWLRPNYAPNHAHAVALAKAEAPAKAKGGFTLVELSIVIVIIGLIIAGVTAGKSLVRAAQLRSVITDINQFKIAANIFKLQYNALPGDMINAQSYWPSAIGNGNGDKQITWSTEAVYFWQHLSLAKLLQGTYSGVEAYNPGITFPNAALRNSGYYLHVSYGSIVGEVFPIPNHVLFLGMNSLASDAQYGAPFYTTLTSTEAMDIDTKIDDGTPYLGKVRNRAIRGNTCAVGSYSAPNNAAQVAANQYNISASGILCSLAILMAELR